MSPTPAARPAIFSRPRLIIVTLVVCTALVVGGEWGARRVIEDRLAAGARCQLDDPSADLEAAVVSRELVSGKVGDVRLSGSLTTADGVPADVTVRLDDVAVGSWGTGSPSAESGSAQVTVPLSELPMAMSGGAESPLGGEVEVAADDGVIALEGAGFTVLSTVDLVDEQILITPETLRVGGQELAVAELLPLLSQRAPQVAAQLDPRTAPLPDLPAGSTATGVTVTSAGLVLDADLDPTLLLADASACT